MNTSETTMTNDHGKKFRNQEAVEITGEKIDFSFGENWKKYLEGIDDKTIVAAEEDFKRIAGVETLEGQTFLDLGCGSGMNSLIAYRLKADKIVSIDYDPNSVEATTWLRKKYADDDRWEIKRGSVLDQEFMDSLGTHNFVLSWGVLHHTGSMWEAIENATKKVEPGGKFFIALYNHNRHAHRWLKIKRLYNRCPRILKKTMICGHGTYGMLRAMTSFQSPFSVFKMRRRGMDYWRDIEDWLGGLPYEYCKPDEVIDRLVPKGFALEKLTTTLGHGCNEFVFRYNKPNTHSQ